jgi:uncharacterized protein YukE
MTDATDLAALHEQLESSMQEVASLIEALDGRLTAAKDEWTSKGAHEFSDAWHNGFKPSLEKFCQALAVAGTDVAFQHNQIDGDAGKQDLGPLSLPR